MKEEIYETQLQFKFREEVVSTAQPAIVNAGTESSWPWVSSVLQANYSNPDIEAARTICSSVAAHTLGGSLPVWILAIAPPGSAKTDLLEGLRGLPRIYFVDEVTKNTFLSGKVDQQGKQRKRKASLLHRIGKDGIMVAADFSTYTSNERNLGEVLSQLRRIYDGNYSREFGLDENEEERSWEGRLTLLAGATTAVDGQYGLFQSLGERFLRVRWPRAGGVETGLRAMEHTPALMGELRAAMGSLLGPLLVTPNQPPSLSEGFCIKLSALGELITLARAHVERHRYTREMVGLAAAEGNTRLPQQLRQLACGSVLLDGRTEGDENDFQLVSRVALDSMPPVRRSVLVALIIGERTDSLHLPPTTLQHALEDLQAAGVVQGFGQSGSLPTLTEQCVTLVEQAGLGEFLRSRNPQVIQRAA